jgi:hypothetical protein
MLKCGFLILPIIGLTNLFLFTKQGTDEAQSQETIQWAFDRFKNNKANQLILGDNYTNVADTGSSSCRSCRQPQDHNETSSVEGIQGHDQMAIAEGTQAYTRPPLIQS